MTYTKFNRITWIPQVILSIPFLLYTFVSLISYLTDCSFNAGGIEDSCIVLGFETIKLFEVAYTLLVLSMLPPVSLFMLLSMAITFNLLVIILLKIYKKNRILAYIIIVLFTGIVIMMTWGGYAFHLIKEYPAKKLNHAVAQSILTQELPVVSNDNEYIQLDFQLADDAVMYPRDWQINIDSISNHTSGDYSFQSLEKGTMLLQLPRIRYFIGDEREYSNIYESFCKKSTIEAFNECREVNMNQMKVSYSEIPEVNVSYLIPKKNEKFMRVNFSIDSQLATKHPEMLQHFITMIYSASFSDNLSALYTEGLETESDTREATVGKSVNQFEQLLSSLENFKCTSSQERIWQFKPNIELAYKASLDNNKPLALQHLDWARKKMILLEEELDSISRVSTTEYPKAILSRYVNTSTPPTDLLQELGHKILLVDEAVKNGGYLDEASYSFIMRELGRESFLYANITCPN